MNAVHENEQLVNEVTPVETETEIERLRRQQKEINGEGSEAPTL